MNILLFLKNLKGRGVSKVYINLAKAFKKFGYNPYIVIREDIIEFDTNLPVNIIKEDITKNIDLFIKEKKIDFIISNNVKYIEGLKNIDINRIFYTVHMLWGERVFKQLRFKKLFELRKEYKNKQIIVDSNAVKNDLLYKIKIKPKFIKVIPDIFDYEEIIKKANAYKPKFSNYILYVAAFSKEKNHELLLKTFSKVNENYNLILIGSGPLEEKIKKLSKKLKIDNRVFFLGFLENPYPYIKNAKLMVSASKNEGLPGIAIESLLLNTPIISTDSKGIRDILINQYSKYICSNKDFLKTINKALEYYPKIDIDYFKNIYSDKNIVTQYINCLLGK